MMNRHSWLIVGIVAVGAALAACGTPAESASESPSQVVPVKGTSLNLITLTPQAMQRIGLRTASVQPLAAPAAGGPVETVPLASLIYLSDGTTWVYTVTGTRTFERHGVTVARTAGDTAMLVAGPPPGTTVVTVGAAELLGSEQGVAGGQ